MLPLKAFVNALQDALRYPDGLVLASSCSNGRFEHHDAGLVLEKPSDRFDIELPEFRYFGWRVVALGRNGVHDRGARTGERSGHGYLSPLSRNASDFEIRSQAFEAGCCVGFGKLLRLSGTGLGG